MWVSSTSTKGRRERYYHRYTFESKETFVAKVVRRLSFTHDDHVLDAYAIFPIGIVARLCLTVSFLVRREDRRFSPFETVIPGFNGVLLYAMGEIERKPTDELGKCSPIRVPIPCGPASPKL